MQSGMSFAVYLRIMALTSLLAWLGWIMVLLRVDPIETGALGLFLFYVTLFAALLGTVAVLGALYRIFVLKRQHIIMREARSAFRHGLLLSLVAVVSLALSAQALCTWWNMLGLLILIGSIEYLFVSMEESRRM